MGVAHARVMPGNPRLSGHSPIEVETPADAAAAYLSLPDPIVRPKTRRVVVNPAAPNFAVSVTKGVPIARPRR